MSPLGLAKALRPTGYDKPWLRFSLAFSLLALAILMLLSTSSCAEPEGPNLVVTYPHDDQWVNSTTLVVDGTTEPGLKVNVTVDTHNGSRNYTTTALPDGSFSVPVELFPWGGRIIVVAFDGGGNSTEVVRHLRLDTVPPEITMDYPTESPYYTRFTKITVVVSFTYPEYGGIQPPLEPPISGTFQEVYELREGVNEIAVRFSDPAGNEAMERITVIADWTPPILEVTEPSMEGILTNETTIHFEGNVSEADEGRLLIVFDAIEHDVSLLNGDMGDGGSWEYDLVLERTDTSRNATVFLLDRVGNSASVSLRIILDVTPPDISLNPLPDTIDSSLLVITGSVETGIDEVCINDVYYPIGAKGAISVMLNLVEGRNPIEISVQDAAGNTRLLQEIVIRDTRWPTIDLEVPERTDKETVHIRGTTDIDVESVVINGEPFPVDNGTFDVVLPLKDGENTFKVEVTDAAGNTRRRTVVVDRDTPGFEAAVLLAAMIAAVALLRARRTRP